MKQSTSQKPVLSPVNGKPFMLNFDGAEMSSDAGLTLLREASNIDTFEDLEYACFLAAKSDG